MANSEWLRLYSKNSERPLVVGIRKSSIVYFDLFLFEGKLKFTVDSNLTYYAGGDESDSALIYHEDYWDLTEAIEFVKEMTSKPVLPIKAPISRPAQSESIVADITQPKTYRDIVLESIPENSYVTNLLRKRK